MESYVIDEFKDVVREIPVAPRLSPFIESIGVADYKILIVYRILTVIATHLNVKPIVFKDNCREKARECFWKVAKAERASFSNIINTYAPSCIVKG